jgi:NADH-quinone oxidoreductase subunit J
VENLLFYLMAALATVAGVGVVVARSPVVSVVSLLASFGALAIIYLLAGYQFLAAIQILVYGGAVMVLFLFTVMLLNLGDESVIKSESEPLFHHSRRSLVGLCVAAVLGASGLIGVLRVSWSQMPTPAEIPEAGLDPLDELAALMFTRYSLPFEAASILLLATAVGVLVLAKRNRPGVGRRAAGTTTVATPAPAAPAPQPTAAPPEPEEILS